MIAIDDNMLLGTLSLIIVIERISPYTPSFNRMPARIMEPSTGAST